MKNNKYNRLASNSLFFAIGNLGSKLVMFLLLPLYTYQLSTQEYGLADLIVTTVSLLLPIVSLSIYDSVIRFTLDGKVDNSNVFSNSFFISVIGAIVLLAIVPITLIFNVDNGIFVCILLIVQLFQTLFSYYSKAIGNVQLFAFNGIMMTLITAFFNVLFLVIFNLGVSGYLLSIILAHLLASIYLWNKLQLNNVIDLKKINIKDMFMLLKYSIPLIPNSIAWWINSMIDRYFIILFLGVSFNGIFAVASKIPALISVLNSIFFQAWQISAIQEYESEDKSEFYTLIFSLYSRFIFLGTTFILLILKPLMEFLVSDEFSIAWRYVPFLLLTVIYSSFSSFLGNLYAASKNTKSVFTTTVIGAIVNVFANLLLIPNYGLSGAGIASAIGFLIIWIIRIFDTKKYADTKVDFINIVLNHLLLGTQIVLLYLVDSNYLYVLQIAVVLLSLVVNQKLIKYIILILKNRFL